MAQQTRFKFLRVKNLYRIILKPLKKELCKRIIPTFIIQSKVRFCQINNRNFLHFIDNKKQKICFFELKDGKY